MGRLRPRSPSRSSWTTSRGLHARRYWSNEGGEGRSKSCGTLCNSRRERRWDWQNRRPIVPKFLSFQVQSKGFRTDHSVDGLKQTFLNFSQSASEVSVPVYGGCEIEFIRAISVCGDDQPTVIAVPNDQHANYPLWKGERKRTKSTNN
ncbi:uncharacterized protein LOC122036655 [Zingiber officinale]|uniref:uncharacterized protein LOC122036655 n=1 Tax=Zingiber officinale TaxID=94328 RepID=UPI001C4A7F27|nr:uncharacterized protein LOC122036655 [Zingiber officinale]